MAFNKRDIEFLFEIGAIRNMPRGWVQHVGQDVASITEHSFRVVWIALAIARKEGVGDENKIIKMALVHDIAESRVSDLSYIQKVYVKADEEKAAKDMFEKTSFEDFQSDILKEYEKRESIEAKIVKDADNLDIDLELKEIEERGSRLVESLQVHRKMIRKEKLYTDAAKEMWDELQEANVSAWHLTANKWYKIPDAGK